MAAAGVYASLLEREIVGVTDLILTALLLLAVFGLLRLFPLQCPRQFKLAPANTGLCQQSYCLGSGTRGFQPSLGTYILGEKSAPFPQQIPEWAQGYQRMGQGIPRETPLGLLM